MMYRQLGSIAKRASLLCCGCSTMMSRVGKAESMQVLKKARETGVTVFDTADFYGQGDSERLLGNFLKGKRDEAVIITKVGHTYRANSGLMRLAKNVLRPLVKRSKIVHSTAKAALGKLSGQTCFESTYLKSAVDASLKRLQVDYVDLLLLHDPSIEDIRNNSVVETMEALKSVSKISCYGVSGTVPVAVEAIRLYGSKISAVQVSVSPVSPLDAELSSLCEQHNVAVIAREPFDNGRLFARTDEAVLQWLSARNLTLAQAALLYAASFDPVKTIVFGTSSPDHFEENTRAVATTKFSSDEARQLHELVSGGAACGESLAG